MELIVNPMPIVNLGNDTAICIGETLVLSAQNIGFNYKWSTGESTQSININTTGEYEVIVSDIIGCADTSSMNLQVNDLPVVDLGNDTVICEYQSVVLNAENARLNYLWNSGSISQTISVNTEGLYSIEVRDSIGCLGTDDIYVTKELIDDPYLEKEHLICEGTSIILEPNFPKLYTINWALDINNSSLEVNETGTYSSYVVSEYCRDTFEINVTKIDTPDAVIIDLNDQSNYCFDYETTRLLIENIDGNNNEFNWTNFGRTDEVEITKSGEYIVEVTNDYCSSTYSETVEEYCSGKFFVPNAFTPNDDGVNDIFKPISNGHVDGYELRIYDRWGVPIFITNKIEEGWDGRIKESIVLIDVYVYKISYDYVSDSGGYELGEMIGTVTISK